MLPAAYRRSSSNPSPRGAMMRRVPQGRLDIWGHFLSGPRATDRSQLSLSFRGLAIDHEAMCLAWMALLARRASSPSKTGFKPFALGRFKFFLLHY